MMQTITQDELDELSFMFDEDVIRTDYSGRGMYGKECLGIVGTIEDYTDFIYQAVEVLGSSAQDIFTGVRTDSMGLKSIFYWPNVRLETDEERDDD